MYLLRSNGTSVYFTRDIAHHLKKSAEFDYAINVLGEDHKAYHKKILFAMDILKVNVSFNDQQFSRASLENGMSEELFLFDGKNDRILVEHTSANPTCVPMSFT